MNTADIKTLAIETAEKLKTEKEKARFQFYFNAQMSGEEIPELKDDRI